jgi:hypothetical protein
MHFGKSFALLSLTSVATALPKANPKSPSQPSFNCNTNVAKQACCQSKEWRSKDHESVAPKLQSAFSAPLSSSGGLLGGLLGGTLNNLLGGALDSVFIPLNLEVGKECASTLHIIVYSPAN